MEKKLLSLVLALTLCMGLMVFPSSAANQVTVLSGSCKLIFSDVIAEETVYLKGDTLVDEGTAKYYHLAKDSTVTIQKVGHTVWDDNDPLFSEEFNMPIQVYGKRHTFVFEGSKIVSHSAINCELPSEIGASMVCDMAYWERIAAMYENNVFGICFEDGTTGLPVLFTYDESLLPETSSSKPNQPTASVTFSDVKDSDWFKPYVEKAAAAGLMQGIGNGKFDPQGNLTNAQAMVLAYQMHSKANGGTLPQVSGPWYMPYYQYCVDNNLILCETIPPINKDTLTNEADRFGAVIILHKSIPEERLTPIRTVNVPDADSFNARDDAVRQWFNAGILNGDQSGRFNGTNKITRAEMAVILCNIYDLT